MPDAEKDNLVYQLVTAIGLRARVTVSGIVLMSDYEAVFTESEKERYGRPHAIASQLCWEAISLWAESNNYHHPIPFVVEAGTPYAHQASEAFNNLIANPAMKHQFRLSAMVEGCKGDFVGLQAADIVANSTYELADHDLAGGRKPSRWMKIVSKGLNKITNLERRVPNAKTLRERLDALNSSYDS